MQTQILKTDVLRPPVSQLAKTPCPTPKPLLQLQKTVGRHEPDFSLVPTHEGALAPDLEVQNTEKNTNNSLESTDLTPLVGLHRYIDTTMAINRKSKKNPHSKESIQILEGINFMCFCFHQVSPEKNVYLGNYHYLKNIRAVYLPLQYRIFIRLVKSHALLHHLQRAPHPKGGIYTNDEDFSFAIRVVRFKLPKQRLKLLYRGRNSVLEHIKKHYQTRYFTTLMISNDSQYSISYIKEILRQLTREGILLATPLKKGTYTHYTLLEPNAKPLPIEDLLNIPTRTFNLE